MSHSGARWATIALIVLLSVTPARVDAYSVLAHEAMIDAVWVDQFVPSLTRRFPGASEGQIQAARAYAYGGSLIQDLGYYPFGSKLFSNLTHYVRTGDFVAALMRDSRDVNEYAFALGALAHYTTDNLGHPIGVNRAVPVIYPKLREQYGAEVLYASSPSRHVMVEFAFDVIQVAKGVFKSDVYQDLIGFEVATPLLERVFQETYGLELKDVFGDVDLAINTYRRAASQIVPDITRVAWRDKRDEILAVMPNIREEDFVYSLSRQQYETKYGTKYRRPGLLARFIVFISKIVPKIGPFKPLAFEPLTPETERMVLESFEASRTEYQNSLVALRAGSLTLRDTDLDTGQRPAPRVNSLADETYADLVTALAKKKVTGIGPALHRTLTEHFAQSRLRASDRKLRKKEERATLDLAALTAAQPAQP
jgi:hypothetical protein